MKLDMTRQSERYIKKRVAAGLCSGSAIRYKASYLRFGAFLEEKGIDDLRDVTEDVARDYQACVREMKHYKTKELLSDSSQRALLGAVRMFFRELYLEEKILVDPFERVSLDRKRHQIPRGILSKDEIEALMTALRDRYGLFGLAIGEILYGTGIRASELHDLRVKDVNLKSRTCLSGTVRARRTESFLFPRVWPDSSGSTKECVSPLSGSSRVRTKGESVPTGCGS